MIIAEIISPGNEIGDFKGHSVCPRDASGPHFQVSGTIVDKGLVTYNGRFRAMNNIHRGDGQ